MAAARDGRVVLDWADGTHEFRLAWADLIRLQESCDAGPAWIYEQMANGRWTLEMVEQVILNGLIGAGMPGAQARRLVQQWVHGFPPMQSLLPARTILGVALMGAPEGDDDAPGKFPAAAMSDGATSRAAS